MKLICGEVLTFKKLQGYPSILEDPGKVFILVIFKPFFPRDSNEDLSSCIHLNILKCDSFHHIHKVVAGSVNWAVDHIPPRR